MNLSPLSYAPRFNLDFDGQPAQRPATASPDRVTRGGSDRSPEEAGYRLISRSMVVGAVAGGAVGIVAGACLGFHPLLLGGAGVVTGAWAGLGIGYVQALRDLHA